MLVHVEVAGLAPWALGTIEGTPVSRRPLLGTEHEFGVGAVRRIHVAGFRYDGEILRAETGRQPDYRVITSRQPLDHELGTIHFEPDARGCTVIWTTTFRVPVPLVGARARLGGRRIAPAFDDAIRVAGELARHAATR